MECAGTHTDQIDAAFKSHGLIPIQPRQLTAVGATPGQAPAIFLRSESASKRFWEFFTVNIRNRNTRKSAYRQAAPGSHPDAVRLARCDASQDLAMEYMFVAGCETQLWTNSVMPGSPRARHGASEEAPAWLSTQPQRNHSSCDREA